MKIGTKSVLFGVHAFWLHPIVVARGWKRFHKRWPRTRGEWLAIVFHDVGYWGLPNMDGDEGQEHPEHSASFLVTLIGRWLGLGITTAGIEATSLIKGHSKYFAKKHSLPLSDLYAPDKLCVLYEWRWFYILRGWLSGEIDEFVANAPAEIFYEPARWLDYGSYGHKVITNRWHRYWIWLNWYRNYILNQDYGKIIAEASGRARAALVKIAPAERPLRRFIGHRNGENVCRSGCCRRPSRPDLSGLPQHSPNRVA